MWDSMAVHFAEAPIPNASSNLAMKLIEQSAMCPPGSHVLDVGCGTGKHAIALAKTGAFVVATDFSERMLEEAKTCAKQHNVTNIQFSQDDWTQIDIAEKGWYKSFDFVLCSMTPAVCDADTLQKAIDACRGCLLITKPCRRTNAVIDKLAELLGINSAYGDADNQINLIFTTIWNMGGLPQLAYDYQVWNSKKTLEEAIPYYTYRLESNNVLTEAQRDNLRGYLTEIAVNGVVEEETLTTVTAIYCNLAQEESL